MRRERFVLTTVDRPASAPGYASGTEDATGSGGRFISRSCAVTVALAILFGGMFAVALLAQHRNFNSNAYDLGFFDQIIWNTARGRPFSTSFLSYNFLGQHVEPILLVFALAYRWHASVDVLLVSQAAAGAAAALPLYVAARRVLASGTAATLFAAAYLLSAQFHRAMLADFHPEVMAPLPIFTSFACLMCGRPRWALAAFATAFLLKEDVAVTGFGFALVFWLAGRRRQGAMLAAGSVAYAVVVMGVLMPAVRGGPGDLQDRYSYLGLSPGAIVAGAVQHPGRVAAHLTGAGQRRALASLLGGQALLPAATPAALSALPLLLANLLSTHPEQAGLELHYGIQPFALLMVASVLGARQVVHAAWLQPFWARSRVVQRKRAAAIAALLLAASLAGWWLESPLGPVQFEVNRFVPQAHSRLVAAVLRDIPAGASVSAQSGLVPHLSQRRSVFEFPRLGDAQYIVIDRQGWMSSQARDAGYDDVLARLPDLGFYLVRSSDGVELYARGR